MNARCERLLKEAGCLAVKNGRLAAIASDSDRSLQGLIQAVTLAGHSDRRASHAEKVVIRRMSGLPVLAEVVSMSVLGMEYSFHANAMLIFTDLEQEPVTDEAAYRTVYGLTPSEAKLAAILAGGRALAEAAETLSITNETARQRLKSIFTKTDTHRQGELIARLSRISP